MLNIINEVDDDLCWAKCPYCRNNYLPKLKIIYGNENNKNNKLISTTSIVDNVMLYSPKTLNVHMYENANNKNNTMNIDELKVNYNPLFWNAIWYFKINKLPFDFILPYEDNIFHKLIKNIKINEKKEKNISDNFNLTLSDYIEKEKVKLEYKRKFWNCNTELIILSHEINIYIPPMYSFNKYNYLKTNSSNYSNITTA